MTNTQLPKPSVQWYSISVSSVRRVATLLVFVGLMISGFLLLQRVEHSSLRDQAELAIAEATDLTRRLERRIDYDQVRIEHYSAWQDLEAARSELAAERYQPALDRAERSLDVLRRVLNIDQRSAASKNRFVSVQGGVEYRRGKSGAWRRARNHDVLNTGDWVKTSSDGTAEIRLADGAKFVVRRNSLVQLDVRRNRLTGKKEPVTDIQFGWVEISTTRSDAKVTTPKSETNVHRDSEAEIVFDPEQGGGRVATFKGSAEVATSSGQIRHLGALQQVEQIGDLLSPPKPLPGQPKLLQPVDDQQVAIEDRELQLTWKSVGRASRYALQVSRSPLFAANIIEDDDRRKTGALLGLRGEGIFYWQVAAIDRAGARGPWSKTRSFRVAAMQRPDELEDSEPPELEIVDIKPYGSLVIVTGRTEPGAMVEINEEPVSVQIDGSFRKTIQMTQEGFAFIRVVATDAWDNPTELKRRVFIDAF